MKAADIDFVCLPERFDVDERRKFIAAARENGCELPFVAQGNINRGNAAALLGEGFNGLASRSIGRAEDPAAEVAAILSNL